MKTSRNSRIWYAALFAGAAGLWLTAAQGQDEGPTYQDYEIEEDQPTEDVFSDEFGEEMETDPAELGEEADQGDPSLDLLSPNLGLSNPGHTEPVPSEQDQLPRVAVLRGLEKVTARVREIEVPVGQTARFGRLEITVRYCRSRPPEETPETTVYLDVDDHLLDGSVKRIFSGWMFASTPALNPVQHPVYDVWVINCKTRSPGVSGSSL